MIKHTKTPDQMRICKKDENKIHATVPLSITYTLSFDLMEGYCQYQRTDWYWNVSVSVTSNRLTKDALEIY